PGIRRNWSARTLLQPEELNHVAVVQLLMILAAQVETHLVDDLDAEIAQPVVPAIGTYGLVDAPADLVVHRVAGQLAGTGACVAAGPLAAETVADAGRTGSLRLGHRRPQLAEQLRHLVARDVIAALVGHAKPVLQDTHGLVLALQLHQRGAEQL